jgi:hypothetical protein
MSGYSHYDIERIREENADAPKLEFFQQRTVVARKPWKCRFCRRNYRKGDLCFVTVAKRDGVFSSDRSCTLNGDCMDWEDSE